MRRSVFVPGGTPPHPRISSRLPAADVQRGVARTFLQWFGAFIAVIRYVMNGNVNVVGTVVSQPR